MTATSTGDFTVAFIGDSDGNLKKAVIESAVSGIEYANIPVAPGIYRVTSYTWPCVPENHGDVYCLSCITDVFRLSSNFTVLLTNL